MAFAKLIRKEAIFIISAITAGKLGKHIYNSMEVVQFIREL